MGAVVRSIDAARAQKPKGSLARPTAGGAGRFVQGLSAEGRAAEAARSRRDPRSAQPGISDVIEAALDLGMRVARAVSEIWGVDLPGPTAMPADLPEMDAFGHDAAYEERAAVLFRWLYRSWWRVQVRGIERVPSKGRVLLVANHAGGLFAYDGAMAKVALRDVHPAARNLRPLIDDFVYDTPFVGNFMSRCGGVRACEDNALRLLENDEAVIVFPEGTKGVGKLFRDRYRLVRFGRGGFIRVALKTGSPIVPVAIVGAEEIHPVLGRWDWMGRQIGLPYFPMTPTFPWLGALGLVPLPSRWRIEFGEPMDFASTYGPDAASDPLLVNRLAEEVRARVQDMVFDALERRGPAFL